MQILAHFLSFFFISSKQESRDSFWTLESFTTNDLSHRGLDGASSKPVHLLLCSQVFQTLHATGQSSMVRDWVLLSLSNFTQRTPVAMAMWSLSCFFVSASTSQWISALYPDLFPAKLGPWAVIFLFLFFFF